MVTGIKYTLDEQTYSLVQQTDGTWSTQENAPKVAGNYNLLIEVSEHGILTYVDSADPKYNTYLNVIIKAENRVRLQEYVPPFLHGILEYEVTFDAENKQLDDFYADIEGIKNDVFITTASSQAVERLEVFLGIQGLGSVEQRKNYLKAMFQRGSKLNTSKIKQLSQTLTGADCIVEFFSADDPKNPDPGFGLIYIRVLSPDSSMEYRYEDLARALKILIPAHIKLKVVKYFSLWRDVSTNFSSWESLMQAKDWESIKNYIPPQ